jgi:hypothetical protein
LQAVSKATARDDGSALVESQFITSDDSMRVAYFRRLHPRSRIGASAMLSAHCVSPAALFGLALSSCLFLVGCGSGEVPEPAVIDTSSSPVSFSEPTEAAAQASSTTRATGSAVDDPATTERDDSDRKATASAVDQSTTTKSAAIEPSLERTAVSAITQETAPEPTRPDPAGTADSGPSAKPEETEVIEE